MVHSHFAKLPGKIVKFEELLNSDTGELIRARPPILDSF